MAAGEDVKVLTARLIDGRAALAAARAGTDLREVDDCPALRHRHSVQGWRKDGCRCPSTRKAWERKQELEREAARRYRASHVEALYDPKRFAQCDLRKADRADAESIALGYRLPRVSVHTRALAVKIMRERNPGLTDRQVAWKLDAAGQGRWVTTHSGERVYQPFSVRQVQRIQAALDRKQLKHPHRSGSHLDRSGRTR